MSVGAVDSAAKIDVSSELGIKMIKQQLQMQQQMAAALTQPTLVYNADGSVNATPPQTTFDVQM
jgi:hypothetical protein